MWLMKRLIDELDIRVKSKIIEVGLVSCQGCLNEAVPKSIESGFRARLCKGLMSLRYVLPKKNLRNLK